MVTGVALVPVTLDLVVGGETGTLSEKIMPVSAGNKAVAWSSSNTVVATVDATGVITARSAGQATITVTTNCGNHSAQSTVTVFATPAAKEGTCFVATAAFGTPMAEEVEILSRLRDEYLLTNELGQRFVALYNRHSPALAEFISEREWARRLVRIALWPMVRIVELVVD